jgi:type II secretory pathway pseudopilin PulG
MFDVHGSWRKQRIPTPEFSPLTSDPRDVPALSLGPLLPDTPAPLRLCASAPSRRRAVGSRLGARRSPRGIVYPILLGSILIIGVATAGVAELWTTQIKRDKEEELLFRLGEIRRAIIRYRADHNRLPKELKDLLDDRTQLQTRRYLRRIYPDPMTGKADWDLKLVVDRTGAVSGIEDVHSKSTGKPLRSVTLFGKKAESTTYKDW